MSWSAAMYILKDEVIKNHLDTFNSRVMKIDDKWKPAKNLDDLSLMKESHFLDRLENISMIGKDVKSQLNDALTLRNSCSHPNSLKINELKVASHIEILIENVFQRFIPNSKVKI